MNTEERIFLESGESYLVIPGFNMTDVVRWLERVDKNYKRMVGMGVDHENAWNRAWNSLTTQQNEYCNEYIDAYMRTL